MSEVQKTSSANATEMAQQFVQFVMVQAQNILFVLGKIPTPEGATMPPNLPAAKMLIDQLEMIRVKTHGNLSPQESRILDETISNVQVAFAEANGGTPASMMPKHGAHYDMEDIEEAFKQAGVDIPDEEPLEEEELPHEIPVPARAERPSAKPAPQPVAPPTDPDENKKKFFKSYG